MLASVAREPVLASVSVSARVEPRPVEMARSDPLLLRMARPDPLLLRMAGSDPLLLTMAGPDPLLLRMARPDLLLLRTARPDPLLLRMAGSDPLLMMMTGSDPLPVEMARADPTGALRVRVARLVPFALVLLQSIRSVKRSATVSARRFGLDKRRSDREHYAPGVRLCVVVFRSVVLVFDVLVVIRVDVAVEICFAVLKRMEPGLDLV